MRTLSTKGSIQTILILAVIASLGSAQFQVTYGKSATGEISTTNRLIDSGIPTAASAQKNPLPQTATTVAAGRSLYQKNCTFCHSYDGTGKTAAGIGLNPIPADLSRTAIRQQPDGKLFYIIRHGIPDTAMPAWQLPDEATWQLVTFIRSLPLTAAVDSAATTTNAPALVPAHYVGSAACQKCHAEIYEHWKKTPMANVVRDPREHPEAILPDFSKTNALVNFTKDDIALVYGSIWKQRYFKKVGDDYFPLPAQWDVTHKVWKKYFAKDDWWAAVYPPDNFQRPTGPLCDGCHSVNYDLKTKTVSEWNVGCESCHGPGSEHVRTSSANTVVNPARDNYVAASDVCIRCHSQGQPQTNPIDGKYYDWPVGYDVSRKLSDYWQFEEHKLGDTTFTHFADGTAHKNRMQGNDFVTSLMYARGVTCFTCHDAHGTEYPANLRKPASSLCLDCHGPNSPNGPHAPTIAEHTHHKADSAGSDCIACHMPKIAQTLGDVNVRSHTFRFVSPAQSDSLKIPNACNVCHSDKTTAWATAALKTWSDRSPWRVAP